MPAQHDLGAGAAVAFGRRGDGRLGEKLRATRQRAVGYERHSVAAAGLQNLVLAQIRMIFDLVAGERMARDGHGLVDQRNGEVRDPDMARQSPLGNVVQGGDRLSQRNGLRGPMDQRQIDLIEPQPPEARLDRPLQIALGQIGEPDLGGDEDIVADNAAGAQPLAHRRLVFIHRGRIQMAVASAQGARDKLGAGVALQRPGAEPNRRHLRAICRDIVHWLGPPCGGRFHGRLVPVKGLEPPTPSLRIRF